MVTKEKKTRSVISSMEILVYIRWYDLGSTKGERDVIRTQNRKQYEKLRRQCRRLIKQSNVEVRSWTSRGL
ncbi:hypothetical protein VIGAN_03035000 [Vigna angularis var. angularis]|uniref:Uncharacterized protein n=1 Tax=Vigna angularis var. angularis TaxID=157739 RepID=A0A0S3RJQ9_PHAAN|nr:hypothetical protein VIGAN_03035000 [Vigna angularis var. angularis]